MPSVVGTRQAVVLNFKAAQMGECRPAMLRMQNESAVPVTAYEDTSSSAKLAQAPGLTGLTRWTGGIPDVESISANHNVTPAMATESYEFDSRRYTIAKAALKQGLREAESFVRQVKCLLTEHAAYMVGFEGTYNDMYAAAQRGELAPANFRENMTSPYQDELLAALFAFRVGLESSHPGTVCDSIVLGAQIVAHLNYMLDHPDVADGAKAIVESANEFPYTYDDPANRNRVADALCEMATAVPALTGSINFSAFQRGAGKMVASL